MKRRIALFFLLSTHGLSARVEPENPDLIFDPPSKSQYCREPSEFASRSAGFGAGAVTTDIASNDSTRAIINFADGKVLAGGASNNGSNDDFTIARYFPDGSLDTTFATDGILVDPHGTKNDIIHSLLLQTDSRFVAVGRGYFYNYDFALARYLSSGNLDTSFHTDGKLNTEIWDNGDFGRAGALQTDGKILAAGFTWLFGQYNFALVRYNTNGTLDTSFDSDGKATLLLTSSDNGALALALATDGSIVLSGPSYNGADWDFAAVRYLSNGTLDSSFSTDGKDTLAVGSSNDKPYAIRISTSGTILLGGYSNGSDLDYALVRYLSSGALDTAFNTSGKLTHTIFAGVGDDDVIASLVLDSNENIIAGGYSETGNNNDFSIAKYLTNGNLDTSFSTDGKASLAVGGAEDTGNIISIQTGGQVFLAGQSNNGTNLDFTIARFQIDGSVTVSGSVDLSFGSAGNGGVVQDFGTVGELLRSVARQADDRLVAFGKSGGEVVVARYLPNGPIDTSFYTAGLLRVDIGTADTGMDIAMQTDGKAVGVGYATNPADIYILRFTTDGQLDSSFHTDGMQSTDISGTDRANGVVLQTDGKIVAVGRDGSIDTLIVRYETDGSLDTSFSTNGVDTRALSADPDEIRKVMLLPSGQLMGVGVVLGTQGLLERFQSDGSLDTSFHTDGWMNYSADGGAGGSDETFDGLCLDGDNQKTNVLWSSGVTYLFRYLSDGSFDTSFATDGQVGYTTSQLRQTNHNPILGDSNLIYIFGIDGVATGAFTLGRIRTDGGIDTSFNTNGVFKANIPGTEVGHAVVRMSDGRFCGVGTANTSNDFGIVCFQP